MIFCLNIRTNIAACYRVDSQKVWGPTSSSITNDSQLQLTIPTLLSTSQAKKKRDKNFYVKKTKGGTKGEQAMSGGEYVLQKRR